MNIKYLYNIIDLYLKNENQSHKINLNILKQDDKITFSFNMNEKETDKTSFTFLKDDVSIEIKNILDKIKGDLVIINEEYSKNNTYYHIMLQNGRHLSFNGFSVLEINNIRNLLYNITINKEEIRLDDLDKKRVMAYNPSNIMQQAGFASYATLFLVAIYLTDVFLIALLIFKELTK